MLAGSVVAQQPDTQAELTEPAGPEAGVQQGVADPLLIEQHISLGDRAFGILDAGGEIHRYTFEAVEGTRLYIRGERQHGLMQLAFQLRTPSGAELVGFIDSILTPNVAKKKRIFLPETGTYTLEFKDLLFNGGTYTMRTKPKWKQRHKGFVAVDGQTASAPVLIDAVEGTGLRKMIVRSVKPKGNFQMIAGQPNNLKPSAALMDPDGGPVDFGDHFKASPEGKKLVAWTVPLPAIGTYQLAIGGTDGTVGFARVVLKLRFPKGGAEHNLND